MTDLSVTPPRNGAAGRPADQAAHDPVADRIAELEYRLATDSLTGARSRDYFLENYDRFAANHGTLFFIDLDNFKTVNDHYGHGAGDSLLQRVVQSISAAISTSDFIARIGGDEFVVLTQVSTPASLDVLAQKIRRACGTAALRIGELTVSRYASVGCVRLTPGMQSHEAIDLGDTAMRCAKSLGKNRVHHLNKDDAEKTDLDPSVDELRLALERSEIGYYLQPILTCADRRIAGYEALLRWERSDGQILAPAQFLSTLTGAYTANARPPLEFARAATEWVTIDQGAYCCFNISMSFLERISDGNDKWVDEIIGTSPRTQIVFEITEAAVHSTVDSIARTVNSLRDSGIRVALDDFGVGASNMERLQSMQVDLIKIDQRFIRGAPGNMRSQDILKGMIDLAAKIGAQTVVEGIEEREQFDLVRELGADYAQGFYLGRPKPHQRS